MMHDWWTGAGPEGWSGMWFGPLFMVLLLVLLVAGIIAAIGGIGSKTDGAVRRAPTAKDILDERFARGEIDKDEYEERRRALGT